MKNKRAASPTGDDVSKSSDPTSLPQAGSAQVEGSAPLVRVPPGDITEQKRAEEQARLQHTLALALAAASDLKQGLQVCLETALQSSGLDAGGFYLVEETSGDLDFLVPQGLTPEFVQAVSRFEADSDHTWLNMAGLPAYSGFEDPGLSLSEAERREGLKFIAVIPLRHEDKVIGCMNVASHTVDNLPPANRRVLETIAATATQAIARLRAEERLRARESLLNETQRLSKVGGWEWDLIRQTMIWTEEMYRLHDMSAQDIAPGSDEHIRRSAACYGPEHQAAVLAAFHRCVERGENYDLEVPFTSVKGRPMWVRTTAQAVWGENRIVKVVGNLMDITERKQAEQAHAEDEARLAAVIRAAPVGVGLVADRVLQEVNDRLLEMTGYKREELIGANSRLLYPTEDEFLRVGQEKYRQIAEYGTGTVESRWRRKDGEIRDVILSSTPLDPADPSKDVVFTALDITERKRLEAVARENSERLSLAILGADLGTWDWDILTGEVVFNGRWAETLGHTLDQASPHLSQWEKFIHPEDRQYVRNKLQAHFDGHTDFYETEHRLQHRGGDWVWVLDRGKVLERDATGRPVRMCGTHLDITGRKQAEAALEASEMRFKELLRNVPTVAVQGYAMDGTVRYWNRASETFYGYTEKEALAKNLLDLIIPPAMHDSVRAAMRGMVETRETFPASELELTRKDGSLIPVYSSHALVQLPGQEPELFCIDIDLTARKQAEAEQEKLRARILQAQKMESVGRLAGGVAHDFNNMLGIILGHTELAMARVEPGEPLHADLAEIRMAAQRSADLTHQILAFARKQTIAPKVLDLNDTVEGMLKMLRRLIGEEIDLDWKPGPGLWPVKMDSAQIDQILANLCLNARDAISGFGKITVSTRNSALNEESCARLGGTIPGEYVMLGVSDNGCGMDSETLLLVFDPFYTTKETGKGTGLGLATVYGIVKQNNGFINASSEPGQGATFTIYLPRHAAESEFDPANVPDQSVLSGHETILLVEDEPALLKMATIVIESQGYTVLVARSPAEAIRLASEHAGRIDLLLTDVVMPGMNGRDLAKSLSLTCPGLKRLFMSGYTADIIARHGVMDEGAHFIQKPFSLKDLAAKLREALEE